MYSFLFFISGCDKHILYTALYSCDRAFLTEDLLDLPDVRGLAAADYGYPDHC